MLTFEKHEEVPGMVRCKKKPIIIHAKRITEEFRVKIVTGNINQYESFTQGKPGAMLMRDADGELFICDALTFEQIYDWGG